MLNRRTCCKVPLKSLMLSAYVVLMLSCGPHKPIVVANDGYYRDEIAEYRKVLSKNPNNLRASMKLQRVLPLAAEKHLLKAKDARDYGRYQEACSGI